jgi:hypothetical protein
VRRNSLGCVPLAAGLQMRVPLLVHSDGGCARSSKCRRTRVIRKGARYRTSLCWARSVGVLDSSDHWVSERAPLGVEQTPLLSKAGEGRDGFSDRLLGCGTLPGSNVVEVVVIAVKGWECECLNMEAPGTRQASSAWLPHQPSRCTTVVEFTAISRQCRHDH